MKHTDHTVTEHTIKVISFLFEIYQLKKKNRQKKERSVSNTTRYDPLRWTTRHNLAGTIRTALWVYSKRRLVHQLSV